MLPVALVEVLQVEVGVDLPVDACVVGESGDDPGVGRCCCRLAVEDESVCLAGADYGCMLSGSGVDQLRGDGCAVVADEFLGEEADDLRLLSVTVIAGEQSAGSVADEPSGAVLNGGHVFGCPLSAYVGRGIAEVEADGFGLFPAGECGALVEFADLPVEEFVVKPVAVDFVFDDVLLVAELPPLQAELDQGDWDADDDGERGEPVADVVPGGCPAWSVPGEADDQGAEEASAGEGQRGGRSLAHSGTLAVFCRRVDLQRAAGEGLTGPLADPDDGFSPPPSGRGLGPQWPGLERVMAVSGAADRPWPSRSLAQPG